MDLHQLSLGESAECRNYFARHSFAFQHRDADRQLIDCVGLGAETAVLRLPLDPAAHCLRDDELVAHLCVGDKIFLPVHSSIRGYWHLPAVDDDHW